MQNLRTILQKSHCPKGDTFETDRPIAFDKVNFQEFIPALKEAIEEAKSSLQKIISSQPGPIKDFKVIEEVETLGDEVDFVATIFHNINHAETNPEMEKISLEMSPLIADFSNDLLLNPGLWTIVKSAYQHFQSENFRSLDYEEKHLLEKYYRDFTNNGANLDDQGKETLRELDKQISELAIHFTQNVLKSTNEFELVVRNQSDLKGLPDSVVQSAKELAGTKNLGDDAWIFTLKMPSFLPFMKYCDNRDLRKTMFAAYVSRASEGEFNNQDILKKIVKLKYDRARLLGFRSHADLILKERMAETPETVMTFIDDLYDKTYVAAKRELQELIDFSGLSDFAGFDQAYYSEKLQMKKFSFDDEVVRPYLELESSLMGLFKVVKKLYHLEFKETAGIPTYHPDVRAFEVHDSKSQQYIGLFYFDPYSRAGKSSGAWMTNFRVQSGKMRPHVSIVLNFPRPSDNHPSLLSLDDVVTLYHEFGHALHGLLSKTRFRTLAGPNVFWDFVELPSQIMENWVYEKECLELFAKHYQTGELIPMDLVKKIRESNQFQYALGQLRQLSFATIDMAWYNVDPATFMDKDVRTYERQVNARFTLLKPMEKGVFSCSFTHIFSGGYSAGYYSYKWAEVMDADAFELFLEKGIFNQEVATSFRQHILEKGGSEHPMSLYEKFRGMRPKVDALLRRGGLLEK